MTDNERKNQEEGQVTTMTRPRVKRPSMYKVILLNDDYTTMDLVIHILQKIFHKTYEEANHIMLSVHQKGRGVAGVYPYDIATTKIMQTHDLARKNEAPLRCVMEKN